MPPVHRISSSQPLQRRQCIVEMRLCYDALDVLVIDVDEFKSERLFRGEVIRK